MEKFAEYIEDAKLDLRTHQSQGVKWLLNNEINGNFCDTEKVYGGFLADEMGLGKTLQALAFLSILKKYPIMKKKLSQNTY